MSKSKLWKEIGVSPQKYDRASELSPSYDRSSVGKSLENKSQSSHSVRLTRRKDSIKRTQTKPNLNEQMQLFTNKHFNKLDFHLTQVPEQQDNITQHILLQRVKFQGSYSEDQIQKQLLHELTKNCKKLQQSPTKQRKNDVPKLKQKIHKLNQYQAKVKKYVELALKNFQNYVEKIDSNLKKILEELSKQLYNKNLQINKLHRENTNLRQELLKTFELAEELQALNDENKQNSYTHLKSRRNHELLSMTRSPYQLGQQKHKKLDEQIAQFHDCSLFDFRALNSTQLPNLNDNTQIIQKQIFRRVHIRQPSNIDKRQKFKHFLQTKHSLKKKQSNTSENKQKKSESVPTRNISDVKFCRTKNFGEKQDKYSVKKISHNSNINIDSIKNEKFYRSMTKNLSENPKMLRFSSSGHQQQKTHN